jgi:hypothetical protein
LKTDMNKNILKKATFGFISTIVLFSGCTSSFDEVNTSPDKAKDVPISNVMAYVLQETGTELYDSWDDMSYPSAYSGQITKIQYVDEARYQFRAGTIQNKWYYIYLLMNNAKSVEEKALADGNKVMAGVAITWKILLESIATDSWRDVPFFEACRMSEGLLLPKYDKQEDIYPAMIDSLGVASELLASGTGSAVTSGVSFLNDDAGNWLKFCNSMRLRLAMRISGVDAAKVKPIVESLASGDLITENADNAMYQWPGGSYKDLWADALRTRTDYGCCDIMINKLKKLSDPRLSVYADKTKAYLEGTTTDPYVGYTSGAATNVSDVALVSPIGSRFCMYVSPYTGFTPYFRASETYFELAEAAFLGWNVGITAEEAYNKAVTLSLEENSIGSAAIKTYLVGAAKYDGTVGKIYDQWWISLYKNGMEAWSLYRRTGYPTENYIAPGRAAGYANHNVPPFRLPYSIDEEGLNAAQLKLVADQVKDDFWGTQMWWDTRKSVY